MTRQHGGGSTGTYEYSAELRSVQYLLEGQRFERQSPCHAMRMSADVGINLWPHEAQEARKEPGRQASSEIARVRWWHAPGPRLGAVLSSKRAASIDLLRLLRPCHPRSRHWRDAEAVPWSSLECCHVKSERSNSWSSCLPVQLHML